MLRLNGIQAEVLLKLTKEYKPEILHGMKRWKSTQREVRQTDGNFRYPCPGRPISPENILNVLLLKQVLMDDVVYYYDHSVQGNFNTKEAKIV